MLNGHEVSRIKVLLRNMDYFQYYSMAVKVQKVHPPPLLFTRTSISV